MLEATVMVGLTHVLDLNKIQRIINNYYKEGASAPFFVKFKYSKSQLKPSLKRGVQFHKH